MRGVQYTQAHSYPLLLRWKFCSRKYSLLPVTGCISFNIFLFKRLGTKSKSWCFVKCSTNTGNCNAIWNARQQLANCWRYRWEKPPFQCSPGSTRAHAPYKAATSSTFQQTLSIVRGCVGELDGFLNYESDPLSENTSSTREKQTVFRTC